MGTGFNIILPNGTVERTSTESYSERIQICNRLLERWSGYCQDNWISFINVSSPFTPENKVKMFLSSLGYFLTVGTGSESTGIITRYKDIINGSREIPASSCPEYIYDGMYSETHTGGYGVLNSKKQNEVFDNYIKKLDERVEKAYKNNPVVKKVKKRTTKFDRIHKVKSAGAVIYKACVDTEGGFKYNYSSYRINIDECKEYCPVETSSGDLFYEMDCVFVADMKDHIEFYDQNFERISNDNIINVG